VNLTVVGCAGTFPGPDSPCSSYLVEHDGFRLLIDFGNGALGNLCRIGDFLDVDAGLVSHLHGDHCLDLVGYAYARRYDPRGEPPKLPLFGPETLRPRLANAFDRPRPEMVDGTYDITEISGSPMDIGPFAVEMVRTAHPIECYAMRLTAGGRVLTYSADTGACAEVISLAKGSDVFLCEASYDDAVANPPGVHLTGGEAGEHAKKAEVGRLLITHHVPWNDTQRILNAAAQVYDGPLEAVSACEKYTI
jgi:ribonuclease BN (tRNA processing enzyme)